MADGATAGPIQVRAEDSGFGAEVTGVDLAGRQVRLGDRTIPYDQLIVATGATHA